MNWAGDMFGVLYGKRFGLEWPEPLGRRVNLSPTCSVFIGG